MDLEDITDAGFVHVKSVCKNFEIKGLGEYHHLYYKSDTLLLPDEFKNVREIYLKKYHLDTLKFLSVSRLARQEALKMTEVQLELLTDIYG